MTETLTSLSADHSPADYVGHLTQVALRFTKRQDRLIQSIESTQYSNNLNCKNVELNLQYLSILSKGLGCSFYERSWMSCLESLNGLVGRDALSLEDFPLFVRIAALDSLFSALDPAPDSSWLLEGHPKEKSLERAKIIASEAIALTETDIERKYGVSCIGVVEPIVKLLSKGLGQAIGLADNREDIIGSKLFGNEILSGKHTLDLVSESNSIVVTGMTLSNGTFAEITQVAKECNTKVLLFSQTGANFGRNLLDIGVDLAICEPYPFYNEFVGPCHVRKYVKL